MGNDGGIIYGLVMGLQKDEIVAYCFETCGQILMGALVDEVYGELGVCREEGCEFEAGRAECGEVDGEAVWLRKLAPLDDAEVT